MHIRRILLLLFQLLSLPVLAGEDPMVITEGFTLQKAHYHITYLKDSTNELSYVQVMQRGGQFRPHPNHSMSFGYTDKAHWIRLVVRNDAAPGAFVYELANVHLDIAELYEFRNNRLVAHKDKMAMYRNQADGTILKTSLLHPFSLNTGEEVIFLLKAKAISSLGTLITVYADTALKDTSKRMLVRYSIFTGIIGIVCFFALFLFVIIKDRVYLYYAGYALSFWLSIITLRGYFFDTPVAGRFDMRQVLTFCIIFFALRFTETFLSLRQYKPRLVRFIRLTLWYLLLCFLVFLCHIGGIIDLYADKTWLIIVALMYNLLLLLTISSIVLSLITAIRHRYTPGWFFLVSFLPVLGVTILILLSNFSLIPYADLLGSYYVFACSFEFAVLFFGLVYRFKAYKDEKELLLQKNANVQKELVTTLVTGQEMERKRISEELHDSLGQWLAVTHLQVNALSADNITEAGLAQAKACIERSITELRHISHDMMPVALIHGGIGPAIDELASTINATGNLRITHYYDEALKILPDKQTEFALYRIIQESLTNIVKHAGATEASIQLTLNNDRIQLMIEDNGTGFDPDTIVHGKGLKNILSRLQVLGYGKFEISSGKDKGTLIFADIPANGTQTDTGSR